MFEIVNNLIWLEFGRQNLRNVIMSGIPNQVEVQENKSTFIKDANTELNGITEEINEMLDNGVNLSIELETLNLSYRVLQEKLNKTLRSLSELKTKRSEDENWRTCVFADVLCFCVILSCSKIVRFEFLNCNYIYCIQGLVFFKYYKSIPGIIY